MSEKKAPQLIIDIKPTIDKLARLGDVFDHFQEVKSCPLLYIELGEFAVTLIG